MIDQLKQHTFDCWKDVNYRKKVLNSRKRFYQTGYYQSEEFRNKMKQVMTGKKMTEETKKKLSSIFKGIKRSKEVVERISRTLKGHKTPYETRRKISIKNTGKKRTLEARQKMSRIQKQLWNSCSNKNERISKTMLRTSFRPNNFEKQVESLLNSICPNLFSYTGDGSVCVFGYCPDFVDLKNKRIIEANGDYFHTLPGAIEHDTKKYLTYQENGYKVLVIWEYDLEKKNIEVLKQRILEFVK